MVLAIASSPVVEIAWWCGSSLTAASICLMFFMVGFRKLLALAKEKDEVVSAERERILYESIQSVDGNELEKWSNLTNKEILSPYVFWKQTSIATDGRSNRELLKSFLNYSPAEFLFIWNYLHESLRGQSKENLNLIAKSIDLKGKASELLESRLLRNRLLALGTFGNLRDKSTTDQLIKRSDHRDPIISFWATRALLRTDFTSNSQRFLSQIVKRTDWSPILVAEMLKERGADEISKPLVDLVMDAYEKSIGDRQMSRLISYLSIAHPIDYTEFLYRVLGENRSQEVVISCLRLVFNHDALPLVRKFIRDERWQVRMQVVLTLGRIGDPKDAKLLISALNDLEWWVRYRSACALIGMPGITEKRIKKLINTLPNQFARDILNHVLAEIRLKCLFQPSSFTLSK